MGSTPVLFYEPFPDGDGIVVDQKVLYIDLRRADIAAGEGLSAALVDLVDIAAENFRLVLFRQLAEDTRCRDKGSGGVEFFAGDEVRTDLQATAAL